jgi:hypothetical protein
MTFSDDGLQQFPQAKSEQHAAVFFFSSLKLSFNLLEDRSFSLLLAPAPDALDTDTPQHWPRGVIPPPGRAQRQVSPRQGQAQRVKEILNLPKLMHAMHAMHLLEIHRQFSTTRQHATSHAHGEMRLGTTDSLLETISRAHQDGPLPTLGFGVVGKSVEHEVQIPHHPPTLIVAVSHLPSPAAATAQQHGRRDQERPRRQGA